LFASLTFNNCNTLYISIYLCASLATFTKILLK
jgi:hypothetical protein